MITEAILYLVCVSLLCCYAAFLVMILKGLKVIASESPVEILQPKFVSVIIPFRNESGCIIKSLESMTSQNYPRESYEVLYINDHSTDDSFDKISDAVKPDNIRILSAEDPISGLSHKKQAVQCGIRESKGDVIVTTDCDCWHGPKWLSTLMKYYDKNTAFISGPVTFINDHSIFGRLQSIEFAGLVLTGAGLIGVKKPVICNAANLSFLKKTFNEVNGFSDNLHLSSGDDEFLMRKIAAETDFRIRFCFNKDALSYTFANSNLEEFYQQRKRWASKSFYYSRPLMLSLSIIFLFLLSMPVQFVLGIFFSPGFLVTFAAGAITKTLLEYKVMKKGEGILFDKLKTSYFFFAELLHIPYIILSVLSGMQGNFKWKDRRLKR